MYLCDSHYVNYGVFFHINTKTMNTEQYLPKGTVVKCETAEQAIEVAKFWKSKGLISNTHEKDLKDDFYNGWDCITLFNGLVSNWKFDELSELKAIITYNDYKAQYMTDVAETPTDFDPIEPHYYKTDLTDFIEQHGLNFQRGNALKYIVRAGKKDSSKEIEDLQKALWYIQKEIQFVKSRNQNS